MLPLQGAMVSGIVINPERCSGLTNFALSGRSSIIENTRVRPEGAIYTSPMATPWGYIWEKCVFLKKQ